MKWDSVVLDEAHEMSFDKIRELYGKLTLDIGAGLHALIEDSLVSARDRTWEFWADPNFPILEELRDPRTGLLP